MLPKVLHDVSQVCRGDKLDAGALGVFLGDTQAPVDALARFVDEVVSRIFRNFVLV